MGRDIQIRGPQVVSSHLAKVGQQGLRRVTLCVAALIMVGVAQAALPPQVDGQPLPTLAPMLEKTLPAVVNIATRSRVRTQVNPLMNDPFFRHFFNLPGATERRVTSAGSGVIVDARQGYVLTNAHVVRNAEQVEVSLQDGRTLPATLVGLDTEVDLAVLRIEADDLVQMPIADSRQVRVGDFVVAIGNPFGLGHTVTSGIVSALGRAGLRLDGYENYIQTDASINPGNSGGALVNLRGELIGINTAIIAPAGGNVGIGFAIPSAVSNVIMAQLIQHGEVRRGSFGVSVQDLTPELIEAFGLVAGMRGVVVTQVQSESPAQEAGIRAGDVIIEMDGQVVVKTADLRNRIGLLPVGEEVVVTLLRRGKEHRVKARIRESAMPVQAGEAVSVYLEGATLRDLAPAELRHASSGVFVQDVQEHSAAWRAGVRQGDVIMNANRIDVSTLEELKAAVRDPASALLLRINRYGNKYFIVIR